MSTLKRTGDKDREELARIIVGERYGNRRYSGSNPLENPRDGRLVDRILESDWFKDRELELWNRAYCLGRKEESEHPRYRGRTPQDGW